MKTTFRGRFLIGLLILSLLAFTAACGGDDDGDDEGTTQDAGADEGSTEEAEPASLVVAIDFFPVGIHSPYYAALGAGYFDEENLDVTFEHVIEVGAARTVLSGGADIGHSPLTTMAAVKQSRDADLQAFYTIQQTSPMAVLSPNESGIVEPEDLAGKTIVDFAGSATQLMWPVFLERNGVSADDVNLELVDPASRLQLVVQGRADGMLGFWPDNEPQLAAECGCDVNTIKLDEYDVHHLGNGFIARAEFIQDNPDVIERFTRALTRGVELAESDPQEAADLFLDLAGEDVFGDPEVVPDQINNILSQMHTEASQDLPTGAMAIEDWEATIDAMVAAGQMEPVDDVQEFFTNDYIEGASG